MYFVDVKKYIDNGGSFSLHWQEVGEIFDASFIELFLIYDGMISSAFVTFIIIIIYVVLRVFSEIVNIICSFC